MLLLIICDKAIHNQLFFVMISKVATSFDTIQDTGASMYSIMCCFILPTRQQHVRCVQEYELWGHLNGSGFNVNDLMPESYLPQDTTLFSFLSTHIHTSFPFYMAYIKWV
jgi:hypothetical protein